MSFNNSNTEFLSSTRGTRIRIRVGRIMKNFLNNTTDFDEINIYHNN